MTSRAVLVVTMGGLALACGGGGGGGASFKDPGSVDFDFGAPQQPQTTEEQSAAAAASSGMNDALGVQSSDGAVAHAQSESVVNLPNSMSSVFTGSLPMARLAAGAKADIAGRAAAYLSGDAVAATTGFDNPDCWTVTASTITYSRCTATYTDTGASETVIVDGTFHRAIGHVSWDATVTMSMTETTTIGTVTAGASNHLTGDISLADANRTIEGFARSDVSVSASAAGQTESAAVTYDADLDLVYADPVGCSSRIVGGTLTLKRIWSQRPSGASAYPAEYADAAIRFSWLACGSVNVSWGTLR
jgi:hypothetical protein